MAGARHSAAMSGRGRQVLASPANLRSSAAATASTFASPPARTDNLQAERHSRVVQADRQGEGRVPDDRHRVCEGEPMEIARGRVAVDLLGIGLRRARHADMGVTN